MIRKITSFLLILILAGCGIVKKKNSYAKNRNITVEATKEAVVATEEFNDTPEEVPDRAEDIISTALRFSGVRYKFGGTTEHGMDCSGLLYVAFGKHDIALPRVSHQMAEEGKRIRVNDVTRGDLLFFKTSKRGKKINHVGLVVAVEGDEIKFIHSTSSRGVIVSSLREGFWNYSFVKATRIL